MKLDKILINYGLTEKQAKIYLACLELDSAPVQKIALKSALPRTTVYEVLELLKRKSLVSYFLKKKVKYFTAQDPNKLIKIAQNNVDDLKESLPQFNAMFGQSRNKPTTRFYEGKQGMKIILEEILDEAKEIMSFVSADDLFSELGDDFYKFVEKRFKKKIPVKVLFSQDTPKARERQKLGPSQLRQVKILSGEFEHQGQVLVWGNKIAMFSFTNDYVAVVIESKNLAQVQRAMFNYLWDLA
jgi:HTH-type transcriptional regulator, sugar sensing transcriptional regulator